MLSVGIAQNPVPDFRLLAKYRRSRGRILDSPSYASYPVVFSSRTVQQSHCRFLRPLISHVVAGVNAKDQLARTIVTLKNAGTGLATLFTALVRNGGLNLRFLSERWSIPFHVNWRTLHPHKLGGFENGKERALHPCRGTGQVSAALFLASSRADYSDRCGPRNKKALCRLSDLGMEIGFLTVGRENTFSC
jgi:hypothetical protein